MYKKSKRYSKRNYKPTSKAKSFGLNPSVPFSKDQVDIMLDIIATTYTASVDEHNELMEDLLEVCKYYALANNSVDEKFGGMSPKMKECIKERWHEKLAKCGLSEEYSGVL